MSKQTKRLQLLNNCVKQIENLPWITQEGESIQIKNVFICPICLKAIELSKIKEDKLNDVISLEDVPPKSIGGKPNLITCKKCNNSCGHDIDVYLQNELKYIEDLKSKKDKKAKVSSEEISLNATFSLNDDNSIALIIKKENNPNNVQAYFDHIKKSWANTTINVQISLSDVKRNKESANIALLKSAYLLAFKKLGYIYILNSNLSVVREQILNPNDKILSSFIVGDESYIPDTYSNGVYRAFFNKMEILMVIFSFKLGNATEMCRRAIALPPINTETDIYEVISKSKEYTISIIEEIQDSGMYSL